VQSVYERPAGGATVRAVVGDLTAATTDAIVNAANTHLRHGGGVAGAIARAGGDVIQDESDAWVDTHGPLRVGQAAVTGAGALPCRYVLHTAGPVYGQGDPDDETHLRRAVSGALAAAPPDVRTIALPAISAGIYGYPPDEATAIIAAEVLGWLEQHPGRFDRIDLVGMDRATADRFAAGLRAA
jgi:O-acetyl-ADP-ribose deacetylase